MKYLIAGLGNIGAEYAHTRHNIGFDVLDLFAAKHGACFELDRHAWHAVCKVKGRSVHLIKPTTYMNLSGKAVQYWLKQCDVQKENLLVITDDLSLDVGKLRTRAKGSDGGHNGLRNIQEILGTQDYPRMRFGIGNAFPKGRQVDFVLGKWTAEEKEIIEDASERAVLAVECFVLMGLPQTMNQFNS